MNSAGYDFLRWTHAASLSCSCQCLVDQLADGFGPGGARLCLALYPSVQRAKLLGLEAHVDGQTQTCGGAATLFYGAVN